MDFLTACQSDDVHSMRVALEIAADVAYESYGACPVEAFGLDMESYDCDVRCQEGCEADCWLSYFETRAMEVVMENG